MGGPDGKDALKHVFVAVYSPQQHPDERVDRFIKAMLKILVNQPGRSTLDWPKFVRYVAFVYNRLSILGTDVTPFMLRHGGRASLLSRQTGVW